MTTIQQLLAPIRERVEKASSGPWRMSCEHCNHYHPDECWGHLVEQVKKKYPDVIYYDDTSHNEHDHQNAELIAHAPTDLIRLIRAVEEMAECLENYRQYDGLPDSPADKALTKAKAILEGKNV